MIGHRYSKLHSIKEVVIEDYLVDEVDKLGGRAIKGNPRNQRGEADRFCFVPNGIVIIVECKRPGEKPRKNQSLKLEWFRKRGFQATYLDTKDKVDQFIKWLLNYQKTYKVRHIDTVCVRKDCPMRRIS